MKKNKQYWIMFAVFLVVFVPIYLVGITFNPNFSIHDFCMSLASEIVGVVIVVAVIDKFMVFKIARREDKQAEKEKKHQPENAEKPENKE